MNDNNKTYAPMMGPLPGWYVTNRYTKQRIKGPMPYGLAVKLCSIENNKSNVITVNPKAWGHGGWAT